MTQRSSQPDGKTLVQVTMIDSKLQEVGDAVADGHWHPVLVFQLKKMDATHGKLLV